MLFRSQFGFSGVNVIMKSKWNPTLIVFATITLGAISACESRDFNTSEHLQKNKHAMVKNENPYYSRTDTSALNLPDSTWKQVLDPEVYYISRQKGTERAFTGKYWDFEGTGTYYCAACGNALFKSDAKFSSSCGWPSFYETIRPASVHYHPDNSFGMRRIEVTCGRCEGHLGHIFDDGPAPTYKRFCMNSLVLEFEPDK